MACLDAHIFTSCAEVDGGGNYTNFHSNPPQHMWIDVDRCASKQGLRSVELQPYMTIFNRADLVPEAPTWVGSGEAKNRGKPSPRKICGEAASNPRPGDSVRQLSHLMLHLYRGMSAWPPSVLYESLKYIVRSKLATIVVISLEPWGACIHTTI